MTLLSPEDETTPQGNALERLVGEGKKFKDAEALASGKEESDRFVTQLQRELAELREDLKERASLQDLMEELKKTNQAPQDDEHNQTRDQTTVSTAQPMSDEEFNAKVARLMKERDEAAIRQSNIEMVKEGLQNAWGDGWQAMLRQQAKENGVTEAFLEDMAGKSPKALLQLVGVAATATRSAPVSVPRSSVRTDSKVTGDKNYKYYENMRKTNPDLYHNQRTQMEMFNQAKKLGDAFYT